MHELIQLGWRAAAAAIPVAAAVARQQLMARRRHDDLAGQLSDVRGDVAQLRDIVERWSGLP